MFLTLDLSSHGGGNEQTKQMSARDRGGNLSIYEVVKQGYLLPHHVGIGQIFPFLKGAIEERRGSQNCHGEAPKGGRPCYLPSPKSRAMRPCQVLKSPDVPCSIVKA